MIFSEKTKTQPISKEQVWVAWLRVRSHHTKGSGADDVSLAMIEQNPRKYLYPVWNRLASGSYMAPPVKEMRIPKSPRSWRTLGIPTICDRVAQDVIREELTRIVEPLFSNNSYAFRPNRSAHDAIDACKQQVKKFNFVIDLDIKGYFDNINHHNMMTVLRRFTDKSHILTYCERWLKASVLHTDGSITNDRSKGTPQGGVISPLLSNLYLHVAFDMWMEREYPDIPYERFADDIVVHTMTLKQSRFLLEKIRDRLRQFKLELHPKKTKIVLCFTSSRRWAAEKSVPVSFDFLGYKFCPISIPRKGKPSFWNFGIRIGTRGVTHVLSQVKQITKNIIFDIVKIGEQLRPKVLGWIQYYKKAVPSSLRALFHHVNFQLIKWLMHKHREGYRKAKRRYWFLTRCYPTLFIHWQYGLTG